MCLCVHIGVVVKRRKVYFMALTLFSQLWKNDPLFLPMCFPRTIDISSTMAGHVF
jgi:hypothetical protein